MIPVTLGNPRRQLNAPAPPRRTPPITLGIGITTIAIGTTTIRTTTIACVGLGLMCEQTESKVSLDDLYQAYIDCRKHKKNKRGAVSFEPYAIHTLCCLRDEINGRRYKPKPSTCFIIKIPTYREVFCASFRDRIVQHFVYRELNPIIDKMLIQDTCSSRIGKGTDYAIERCARFVRRETDNYKHSAYYGKFDLSGFFMSLNRNEVLAKMLNVLETRYTGRFKSTLEYLLRIIILSDCTENAIRICPASDWDYLPQRKTLFGNDKGLPIGNITSQMFANFFLNDLDHYIKGRHRSFVRFVDDMIIIDKDRERIEETKEQAGVLLSKIGIKLNPHKSIINETKYGIMFLGVKIFPHYVTLSGRKIRRMWLTSRRFKSAEKAFASCSSRKGMLNRYHGRHLSLRWYDSLQDDIKESVKMDSDAHFHLVGVPKKDKTKIRNISLWAKEGA